MESKTAASSLIALFLSLNLLLFALVTACDTNVPATSAPRTPTSTSTPTPASYMGKCPADALRLGVCANVLNLVDVVLGSPPTLPCCSLIQGLVDLEAALCLCTAIRANILGINLDVPVALSLVLNNCGKKVPTGFECS